MSPVSGETPAGAAYVALQRQARVLGRNTDEVLQLYVLEGFLARLAASAVRDQFVLKGGVLLAALDARRPTRDVDLAGLDMSNDASSVLQTVREIIAGAPPFDDGIEFDTASATSQAIREDDEYAGVRVKVSAKIAKARVKFHVDVNIGGPIWPAPCIVHVLRLLGGEAIKLAGYPLAMVYAEKSVTAIQRGDTNTRWRDFGDIWTLQHRYPIEGTELRRAIDTVAAHRNATLIPLRDALAGYPALAQDKWTSWRMRWSLFDLPQEFAPVLASIITFIDPVIDGLAPDAVWNPIEAVWETRQA